MNPDTYIAPVVNKFWDKVERHIKYIVSTSSYVRNLQKKREALNAKKNDINERIDEGERRYQRPTNEVLVWRHQVFDMLDRTDDALNKAQESRSCVSSICSKHKLGRSCDDMIQEVNELLVLSLFHIVTVDCDAFNIVRPMPYAVSESQVPYFAEACNCIEDDNSKANIIGIWGLGGVGKTTLLTMIHNNYVGTSSMFETVIWTVASSEQSDVSRVQREIVGKLGLKEVNYVQSQADLINNYLKNKNFLLFIDDLWKDVDLHKVGVPNPNEENQCGKRRKVIFTTRSMVVCGNMEAKKIIEVKCLDPKQSLILFAEKVGQEIIQSHPGIPELAIDIAKECHGLPLALITIGRAMSTKLKIEDWKRTRDLLKDSQGLHDLGVDEQLLSVLKISYDYLATEPLRNCFLTISMWPEDHVINTKELIEFWMGIDLIAKFGSKHEAYQFGHSLIGSLRDACLLEEVEVDKIFDTGRFVKMHDVLRDLALWLASDCDENKYKWMVKAGINLQKIPTPIVKEKWMEAEYISLMRNKIGELPTDIPSCPSLSTLLLSYNRLTGNSCFGKFHCLNHLDLSENSLCSFPESICDLKKLRYLNLSSNRITNLPRKLINLKMLRYLILRNNLITNIPSGVFVELVELLVLDMFKAIDTMELPSIDVEELKSIEKKLLSFGTTVKTEEELSKLMLLSELPIDDLCIEDMRSTTFHFMAMIRNAYRLKELYIERCYDGLLEIVFDKNETYQDIASLKMNFLRLNFQPKLERIIWKDIEPKILFDELRIIEIWMCDRLENITWVIHLRSLQHLSIVGCKSMKIAINNDVDPQVLTFPSLEKFLLSGMAKLELISIHSLAFPQLKHLSVMDCPLLKSLPLEVKTTPKLRKIEGEKEWWEKVEWWKKVEDDKSRSHFHKFFQLW